MENQKQPRTLGQRILAKLNLGEEGKLMHFLDKLKKNLEKDIKSLNKNIDTYKSRLADKEEEINEKLVDAKTELEDNLENITAEDVKSMEAQNNFVDVFWDRYEESQSKIKSLEKQLEEERKHTQSLIENAEEQIAERQARIEKIS